MADPLIAMAVKEKDNFETVKVQAKVARKVSGMASVAKRSLIKRLARFFRSA